MIFIVSYIFACKKLYILSAIIMPILAIYISRNIHTYNDKISFSNEN